MEELSPLPFTKHQRVWFEVIRTVAAISSMTAQTLVLLKVFKVI